MSLGDQFIRLEQKLESLTERSILLGKNQEYERVTKLLETAFNASSLTWSMEQSKGFRMALELLKENK